MLSLAEGFAARGHRVDLLRTGLEWEHAVTGSSGPKVVDLVARSLVSRLPKYGKLFKVGIAILRAAALPRLALYLAREKPQVVLVGLSTALPFFARAISRANARIVVTVQGLPRRSWTRRHVWGTLYPRAASVVAPTQSVARETAQVSGLAERAIQVIPNPVLDSSFAYQASDPVDHPWFGEGPPIVLGVGRLTRQKGFDYLIPAFDLVRQQTAARLVILGDGEDRQALQQLVRRLNLDEVVDLPGYVQNPYAYMSRAAVFVLSSRWEGPGHVLVEALAAGAPVVSTDCPFGPRDVLLNGRAGLLVPVGDPSAMAAAILQVLQEPQAARQRARIGRLQTHLWQADSVVDEYLDVVSDGRGQPPGGHSEHVDSSHVLQP